MNPLVLGPFVKLSFLPTTERTVPSSGVQRVRVDVADDGTNWQLWVGLLHEDGVLDEDNEAPNEPQINSLRIEVRVYYGNGIAS